MEKEAFIEKSLHLLTLTMCVGGRSLGGKLTAQERMT